MKATGAILLIAVLWSCAASPHATELKRTELFKIGYGYSDSQITRKNYATIDYNPSPEAADAISIEARNGLYHILSGNDGKIMRFSSYGDLLLVIQDERYNKTLKNSGTDTTDNSPPEEKKSNLRPRIAPDNGFQQLAHLAVDSSGTMYVSDKLSPSAKAVYDEKSQAYCDSVVRRFSKDGTELGVLGQEGIGGSPFPFIQGIWVTDDDKLAIVAASNSSYHVFFFNTDGSLLSSLKVSRSTIPLPDSERSADSALSSATANIETLMPMPDPSSKPRVIAKVDYYQQNLDSVKNFQSWIFNIDASLGEIMQSIKIPELGNTAEISEIIGVREKRYYLMQKVNSQANNHQFTLVLLLESGVVSKRYLLELPTDVIETTGFSVGTDGMVYCLGFTHDTVICLSWVIP